MVGLLFPLDSLGTMLNWVRTGGEEQRSSLANGHSLGHFCSRCSCANGDHRHQHRFVVPYSEFETLRWFDFNYFQVLDRRTVAFALTINTFNWCGKYVIYFLIKMYKRNQNTSDISWSSLYTTRKTRFSCGVTCQLFVTQGVM